MAIKMVKQYYVYFKAIGNAGKNAGGIGMDMDYDDMPPVAVTTKGAKKLNLPNIVQAGSFIEAVKKIDAFMIDNGLNGKYTISRLEENNNHTAILV